MRAYERLLKYIRFDTASDETSETCPSTEKQLLLAEALADEMRSMGLADVRVDENGYVYGFVPETVPGRDVIGLISHMDTVNSVPVLPMNERIIETTTAAPSPWRTGTSWIPRYFRRSRSPRANP